MSPPSPLAFSYFTDPLCIWAFVAQTKLDQLLADFGERLEVEHRIVPIFGSVPWRFAHGPWAKQGVAGRIDATREIAAKHGHPEVDGECWAIAAPASSWSPGAAVKAVCAMERSRLVPRGSGGEYNRRLRERFFVHKENIALQQVQLENAEALSLPRAPLEERLTDGSALAALWEDHLDKERLRIQGSPTYVLDGGRAMLFGNFTYGVLHATVEELLQGECPDGSPC